MGDINRIGDLTTINHAMSFLDNEELGRLADRLKSLTTSDKRKELTALSLGRTLASTSRKNGKLTVLPYLSFEERMGACKYYWKSMSVSSGRFGTNAGASGDWEWNLHDFGRSFSTEDGERSLPSSMWIHGQAEHLFAFGATHHELLRDGPVMAFDARCEQDGHVHVAVLEHDGAVMHISTYRLDNDSWPAGYRLLHVKKSLFSSSSDVVNKKRLEETPLRVLPAPSKSLFRK